MVAEPERQHHVARDQPAQFQPLAQALQHRPHHEAERLKRLDAVIEFDRFGENFGGTARDEPRGILAARDSNQLDAATPEPAADRVGIEPRQLAEAADPHRASVNTNSAASGVPRRW